MGGDADNRRGGGRPAGGALEILGTGLGLSLQDLGRRGWKRYGVPPGGAMDRHAAVLANRLLGNPPDAPVLEVLWEGARFRALARLRLARTGAARVGGWKAFEVEAGEEWGMGPVPTGVWSYLAVAGGWAGVRWFGSVSAYPRGGLGVALRTGDRLSPEPLAEAHAVEHGLGGRWICPAEVRDYGSPPEIPVWPGPQRSGFPESAWVELLSRTWVVSARSDRTGYRLEGEPLEGGAPAIASEPVLPGTIQVPPGGAPIITQRDGPTVGGYPKLGLIDPLHLSWVAQHRPGQRIRFKAAEGEGEGRE